MAKTAVSQEGSGEAQELLDLAVNCKFISPEKETEILPGALEYSKEKPDEPIAKYLLEKKVLSKDKLKLLLSIKNHVDMLLEDKKFGKLGIANQFVEPDKVKKALDIQVEIFRKNKKSIKIGDILVQSNDLSVADKTALLLTQNRIKDELLSQALNDIAKDEIEQMEINRRFGAIAVKKKLITKEQLSSALKLQKKEVKKTKKKRYLGDILKELYDLSDKHILAILKIQKNYETKRMNLEEKLEEYHKEKEANQVLEPYFEYRVSEDNLTAFIRKTKKYPEKIPLPDFLNWFALSGIKFGLCEHNEIRNFLDNDDLQEELEIAKGIPAKEFTEESVDFKFDTRYSDLDNLEDENGKKLDPADAPEVQKNDLLAIVTPHEDAKPGTDVFGRIVQPPEKQMVLLNNGEGVYREEDRFVALVAGQPRLYKNRTIFVIPKEAESFPVEEVRNDITEDTGDRYSSCVLKVSGNIGPGIQVSCHDLIIEGEILGNVSVEGDIDIRGNIGKMPANVKDTGEPITITAKGDIQATGNIMNASIVAGKGVQTPKGDIVSCSISSCRDIMAKNIYSSRKAPSIIRVTRDNFLEIEKIDKSIKEASDELNKLLHKDELDELTEQLMTQGQVQNGYLEKQNAIIYLKRLLDDEQLAGTKDIREKHAAFKEKNKECSEELQTQGLCIPENTKAYKFMEKLVDKLRLIEPDDQHQALQQFQDNISGLYKEAAKATERINKKYTVMSKAIETAVEKSGPKINLAEEKIEKLNSKRDLLLLEQKKSEAYPEPVIRIKNQVEKFSVIMGEKAKKVIKESIHGVTLKEKIDKSGKKAKIIVEGYY